MVYVDPSGPTVVVAEFQSSLAICSAEHQLGGFITRSSGCRRSHRRPRLLPLRSLLLAIAQSLRIRTRDIAARIISRVIEAIVCCGSLRLGI